MAVMPQGVEHGAGMGAGVASILVAMAVMPQGVEHELPSLSQASKEESSDGRDAARR